MKNYDVVIVGRWFCRVECRAAFRTVAPSRSRSLTQKENLYLQRRHKQKLGLHTTNMSTLALKVPPPIAAGIFAAANFAENLRTLLGAGTCGGAEVAGFLPVAQRPLAPTGFMLVDPGQDDRRVGQFPLCRLGQHHLLKVAAMTSASPAWSFPQAAMACHERNREGNQPGEAR
jgi:hypothetical protein